MAGRPPPPPIKCNLPYLCSFNLVIMKIFEMVFMVVTLIFALRFEGQGTMIYIEIVAALAIVTALSWVILYAMNLNARFPEFFPVLMLCYHALMALLTIGATVCGGILWPQFKVPTYVICTILSFLTSILFVVDTVLSLLWWRGAVDEISTFPCSPWKAELI